MSMLHRNWLEPGYYIEDDFGELTKTDNPSKATHHHDGLAMVRLSQDEIQQNQREDISFLSHWKEDDTEDTSMFSHWQGD